MDGDQLLKKVVIEIQPMLVAPIKPFFSKKAKGKITFTQKMVI